MTRGVARRDFSFPPPGTAPSLVVTARSLDAGGNEKRAQQGIAVVTVPESRWARPDIKSISLLPNVLAKQAARDRGAGEAWFVDRDGRVTEGASSNAWIVTRDGKVVTRPADNGILRGITRTVLIAVIQAQNLLFEERPFTVQEAYGAAEAFVTAASQIVMPVVRIDDRTIGGGSPGPVARALRERFHQHAERS
jgi:D-alanine transaminase